MTKRETYLDWNATAPLRREAAAAMQAAMARCGNPSSVHRWGRAARHDVERARASIAALIGLAAGEIVFTGGGTEANHLALLGSGRERILVSAIEHNSVLQAAPAAEPVAVDADGIVDLARLERQLAADSRPSLVSVMLANNETGVIEPIHEIAGLAHAYGALLHCDMIQGAGRMALDIGALGTDLATLSAHKIGGPPGIGAVAAVAGIDLVPMLRGGGQEHGRRAGSENTIGIAGFAAAAEAAAAQIELYRRAGDLRDRLEAEIAAVAPDAVIVAAAAPRLPNTSAVAMPGVAAETQVIALDLAGIMVSAGAACSSGKVGPSHVLAAMGLGPDLARSTIRVSLGWDTTEDDIAHFLDAWTALYRRAGRRRAA